MNDLLASVLAATESANAAASRGNAGPVIVSQNHDPSAINWVAGVTDPGEMIGCGAYQQLRRLAGESDTVYQARLNALMPTLPAADRAKIESAMRAAANRRAGLDTSNGRVRMMVAGKPAWHGLGVNVAEAVTSEDAIRLAGMNWRVGKIGLQYLNPVTGAMSNADGNYGIVREDTGAMLGSVGSRYQPFQNADGFDFLDSIVGKFGARYESAGSLYGGSKVWMLVHLPKQSFAVNGTDRVEPYVLFTNSHDGTSAARVFPTTHRVVCANTLRVGCKADQGKGMVIRHTGNLAARVAKAQQSMGLAIQGIAEFQNAAETLAMKKIEPLPYFQGLLDAVCDVTAAQTMVGADALAATLAVTDADRKVEAARIQKSINQRKGLLEELLQRYESPTNGVAGMRGSGWAALNAATEAADHGKLGGRTTGADKASRRFESIFDGNADDVKQVAYAQAMAMAT